VSDSDLIRQLLQNDIPLFDTRAPIEFASGAVPSAVNLPLMSDEERAKVGTCYKQQGVDAAIRLGNKLVSGSVRDRRMAEWIAFAKQHPQGYLYCARGGLRSHTVQQWLADAGYQYPLVPGGFKAIRRYLIDALEAQSRDRHFVVLSGRTGTGKTRILNQLPNSLDLEGRANHRGSSFGRHVTPQPTQITFEHAVTLDMLKNQYQQTVVEDESQVIGALHLPDCLHNKLQSSAIVVVEQSLAVRVENVLEDYVTALSAEYVADRGPEQGFADYKAAMLAAIDRVKKRLGGVLWQEIRTQLSDALNLHEKTGDIAAHRVWIAQLLSHYYDRMYDYQLSRKQDRVLGVVSGPAESLAAQVSVWAPPVPMD
jgi:tRNA 2-selenouridine synthase